MEYEVEYTDQFEQWWNSLDEDEQVSVDAIVGLLIRKGPELPYPYSSAIKDSKYGEIRELRIQHKGRPYRILYAFDPRRVAILLIGGDKTGNARWYKRFVPIAEKLYAEHLNSIQKEGNYG